MISSQTIFDAMTYYGKVCGYRHVDVPMLVSEQVNSITCPNHVVPFKHSNGDVYTGSAEQGFLQLLHDMQLDCGKHMALTPCWRNEPVLDDLHLNVFVKLELIHVPAWDNFKHAEELLDDMIHTAMGFVASHTQKNRKSYNIYTVPVSDGGSLLQYDIMTKGIEIGSYGIRKDSHDKLYVFGTGIAEPRFTYAINKK
jgi:aspartyl/asparaginyl-tRNA synthetase